jgi:hypothetical protein
MLKSVVIPEYYLGGNVELLGESGIRISSICKDLHSKCHTEIWILFGKKSKAIKTLMSEGYHPEVDDSPLCTEYDSAKYRSIIGCCI